MRRTLCLILSAILIFALLPFNAFAISTAPKEESIIRFSDGSYIIIEIIQDQSRANNRTGTKIYSYNNVLGVEEWRATLTGSYIYNGTSVTCTSSECDVTISNSSWSVSSKTTRRTVDTAIADVTMTKKVLGITTDTKTIQITLTCSPTGVLS